MAFSSFGLPSGFRNTTGGPTDEYYYDRPESEEGRYVPYPTPAAACARVPEAARSGQTVNIMGVEWHWLYTDTSNEGLVLKTAGGGTLSGVIDGGNASFRGPRTPRLMA